MLTLHVHKIAPSNTFVKRIFKKIFDISVKCDIIFTVPIIGIASYINTEIFMKNHSKKRHSRRKCSGSALVFAGIFFAVCLVGLAAYLTVLFNTETDSSTSALVSQTAPSPSSQSASETSVSETSAKEMASILWVGDSRTAGMRNALATLGITDSCTFIAKDGEGFRWFKESALPELNAALSQNPDTIVVSNMGVNDLADLDAYISLYYELFDQYPDTRFYILSVNPADEDCTMVSNRDIETFNAGMYAEFPSRYLECYNYLKQTGYETVDGLHYTEETYQKIHDFATSKVSD